MTNALSRWQQYWRCDQPRRPFNCRGHYEPGGVKVFDADTLELVADIPATTVADGSRGSRVVGMVDAPGQKFLVSLFDTGEIWIADFSQSNTPKITRFTNIGNQPYDSMLTPDGRYYIAGLFGEDGMALLDLWHPEHGVKRILDDYGRGNEKLPVYKMPHLEGWTVAGDQAFVPAIGRHKVLVMDTNTWQQTGSIDTVGQPVFVMARPDARQIWSTLPFRQSICASHRQQTRDPCHLRARSRCVAHGVHPRGEHIWISVRDKGEVQVWDTATLKTSHPTG